MRQLINHLIAQMLTQYGIDRLRHTLQTAADIKRRAALEPAFNIGHRQREMILDITAFNAITRKHPIEPPQNTLLLVMA